MPRSGSLAAPNRCGALLGPLFVIGGLALAAVAAAPAAAQAQSIRTPDAVGDVVGYVEGNLVPLPERTLSDVSDTILTHGTTRVRIHVDYVDIQQVGHQELDMWMVTNEGVRRHMELSAHPGAWSGLTWMWTGKSKQTCMRALRHSVDYQANVMEFSFPRRCASNPRWVKFRIVANGEDKEGLYADDAFRDRALTAHDRTLKWSSKVYR